MIPKRIFQFWIKKDKNAKIPEATQKCINDVKKWCDENGYEHILIDENSDILKECVDQSKFCKKILNDKKWFFTTSLCDYVRLYVLHKYGGIYLDCDVEIRLGFDEFLENDYFMSLEPPYHPRNERFRRFDCGTIGGDKQLIFKQMMAYFDNYYVDNYFDCVDLTVDRGGIFVVPRVWIALPDLFPFIIKYCYCKEIEIINERKKLEMTDTKFEIYNEDFFSRNGKYSNHCFHNTYTK